MSQNDILVDMLALTAIQNGTVSASLLASMATMLIVQRNKPEEVLERAIVCATYLVSHHKVITQPCVHPVDDTERRRHADKFASAAWEVQNLAIDFAIESPDINIVINRARRHKYV